MPRTVEIDYYARLLAGLTVSAARAKSPEALSLVYVALGDALSEIFTVLSHDAGALRPDIADDLLVQAAASAASRSAVLS